MKLPIRATIAAVAIIPDTPEERQRVRDLVETALLQGGVRLQGMIARYDKLEEDTTDTSGNWNLVQPVTESTDGR